MDLGVQVDKFMVDNFSNTLYNMLEELTNLPSRQEIIETHVKIKLEESYNLYKQYVQKEIDYLMSRDTLKVIKNIDREEKRRKQNEE